MTTAAVVVDRLCPHPIEFALLEREAHVRHPGHGIGRCRGMGRNNLLTRAPRRYAFLFPDLPTPPPGAKCVGIPLLAKLEIAGNPPVIEHTLGILVV